MKIALTDEQAAAQRSFRAFAESEIIPYANQFDREERIPADLVRKVAQQGYLGSVIPAAQGGSGSDMITFGLLNQELGRGCSSVRSLLTVHSMLVHTIHKRGSQRHKEAWLAPLIAGDAIGAFALSEPQVGSDAKSVETRAEAVGESYILNGCKKWITFGQIADLYLIFAQLNGKVSAFLVERGTPGLSVQPIRGMLGTRASMLAELHLENCTIPKGNLIGGAGFGLATIATAALDIGRYSVAWGSVGIAQACLDDSIRYSSTRKQFDAYLKDHQLIREMITDMVANVQAARLLCLQAGYLKDIGSEETIMATMVAKYFAARVALKSASDAVQIHGANGCSEEYAVQRYFRDAKVMEIIEGSNQIQQLIIAKHAYEE